MNVHYRPSNEIKKKIRELCDNHLVYDTDEFVNSILQIIDTDSLYQFQNRNVFCNEENTKKKQKRSITPEPESKSDTQELSKDGISGNRVYWSKSDDDLLIMLYKEHKGDINSVCKIMIETFGYDHLNYYKIKSHLSYLKKKKKTEFAIK